MNGNNAKFSAVYDNQRYCPLCGRPWAYSPAKTAKSPAAGRQEAAAGQRTAFSGGAAGSSAGPAPMAGGMQSMPMTGMQTGGAAVSPEAQTAPITDATQPAPLTMQGTEYLNGFLRTQIGKQVLVQFLLGSNSFVDKSGRLLDVGANYILLQPVNSDDLLVCDFFNIRFVTIYQ